MFFSEMMIQLVNPVLLILLILLVYSGYRKGFLSKLLSCFSFIVVAFLAWQFSGPLSKVFEILPQSFAPYQNTPLADFFYQYANQIFIFAVLVILASIVLFLLKPIVLLFKKLPVISLANSLLGALFGVVEMMLLCFVLLFVLHTPMVKNGAEVIENSFFSTVEVLQNHVITIGSDLLEDFDVMSDTAHIDVNHLKEMLSEHGYTDEQIRHFIEQLGDKHE